MPYHALKRESRRGRERREGVGEREREIEIEGERGREGEREGERGRERGGDGKRSLNRVAPNTCSLRMRVRSSSNRSCRSLVIALSPARASDTP
jgi:hypothetical protein